MDPCLPLAPLVTTTLGALLHPSLVALPTLQFLQMGLRCHPEDQATRDTTGDHHGLCSHQVRLGLTDDRKYYIWLKVERVAGGSWGGGAGDQGASTQAGRDIAGKPLSGLLRSLHCTNCFLLFSINSLINIRSL